MICEDFSVPTILHTRCTLRFQFRDDELCSCVMNSLW